MTLIIYDNAGRIFSQVTGDYILPQGGVQYMEIEVPEGRLISGVDVSATPHEAVLIDAPPSEVEKLRLEMAQSNVELFEMMLLMTGGMA